MLVEAAMTTDEAKAFVRRHFEEFVNNKNHDIVLQTLSDDFYDHDGPDGKPTDREGDRRMMIVMHQQIPDLHLTIEDMIAEGDKVVCRNVWRGTTTDGRKIESKGIVIWRLAGGRIVERWASVVLPSV
jgi:predicted ester cyclase